jgi:hypothetical protein
MPLDQIIQALKDEAAKFDAMTKQVYPSCRFAALNVWTPRSDWEVWGDFTSCIDAIQAAKQWQSVYRADFHSLEIVSGYYRVAVSI